ncbi:DNA primase [Gloeobacter kilaueensis]|uniref:DNA primase n=1 Tax=Gloeobacter kilaueensis (strain ATCC BAA-2537 / CCAP 1431/1 / ULC 316 / JS1) TaxID=1183438 RepID=U5QJZ9_GLOK1|nr:DNA primase [Gloeobacter kilaueensis]AGY59218.1 DNA primase [Gloeobacter kilaueensis JS1]
MSAPQLHPRTIDEVRTRAELVDVVSERVVLRKAGRDFKGLCPFHEDRNPSFFVSPTKQIYKCFSCGASGDVFKFVMELDKSSFSEVVLELARRYGVSVQMLGGEQKAEYTRRLSKRQQLGEIVELAAQFYSYALWGERGSEARSYLLAKRALTEKTIRDFRLGYAPQGWQTLYTYLVEQKRFPAALVEEAGLIVARTSGSGYYDRFRHRLMIPICDGKGQVIAFGGRAMGDDEPKYLNSPESELFDKGQTLFALHAAREAVSRTDTAIVVEGYFDAIALHQAGIAQVVATLGTALRADQIKQLLRYSESKRVVLNFDGDQAGIKAAERAIGELRMLAVKSGVQLRILTLPTGKDPDEFLRAHPPQEYLRLAGEAPLWVDWQIERFFAGRDLTSAAELQQVSQQLVELLSGLMGSITRTHYIHLIAGRLSGGNGRLASQLEDELRRRIRTHRWGGDSQRAKKREPFPPACYQAEVQLLQIYLHFPEYREDIHQGLEENELEFSVLHHRQLWQKILELREQMGSDEDVVVALRTLYAGDPELNGRLGQLLWLNEHNRIALMRPRMVIRAGLATLQLDRCERRYAYLNQLCDEAEQRGAWEESDYFVEQRNEEYHRINALKSHLTLKLGESSETVLWQESP